MVALVAGARGERQVDGGQMGVGSPAFVGKPAAGVEGAPVLVQGYEERVGVVVVDVLGAVALMDVGVYDGPRGGPRSGGAGVRP